MAAGLTSISTTSEASQRAQHVAGRSTPAKRGLPGAPDPALVVIGLASGLALLLRLYQLLRPGFLLGITEYDDGVYFGSAVRLVHGVLPYRDFVMVQPPGITLLMAPVALLAKATGTDTGLGVARILTACAGAGSVTLAGLLVRRKGVLATSLACGIMAVFPAGINAAHTVLLEPWLVLSCLIGAVAVFDGEELTARPRRLAWGGAAFGFACAIKLWAALPLLVVLVLCRLAHRWRPFLGGALAGFAVPVLPFVALAPGSFYRDVVAAQLFRIDVTRVSGFARVMTLTGLNAFAPVGRGTILATALAIAGFVALCLVGAWLRTRRAPPPVELFALVTAALVLAAFLWPPDFWPHYAWFFAPFLALSLALPAARMTAGPPGTRSLGAARASLTILGIGLVTWMAIVQLRQEAKLTAVNPAPAAHRQIPAGACVLTDIASLTIISDRFVSSDSRCSPVVDSIGSDYALARGRNGNAGAGRVPAVQALWLSAFAHAQYVWLACKPAIPSCLTNRRIAWTPRIRSYFSSHFTPVRGRGALPNLYVRDRA